MIYRFGYEREMSAVFNRPFVRFLRFGLVVIFFATVLMGAGRGCVSGDSGETVDEIHTSFSIYTLSRGKGVPDSARQALVQSRDLLLKAQSRGEVLRLMEHRIGLEGETRLCVEFDSAESAQNMRRQVEEFTQGVDLFRIKAERCPQAKKK